MATVQEVSTQGSGICSLYQLAALGPQDRYLTIKPEYSFFKSVYKKYAPFAMETLDWEFTTPPLNIGTVSRMTLPRKGDFLGEMFLQITLPNLQASSGVTWIDSVLYKLIRSVKLYFDATLVHSQDKYFYDAYDALHLSFVERMSLYKLTGRDRVLSANQEHTLYLPFRFFFTGKTDAILSRLPLVAMTNTNVFLEVALENVTLDTMLVGNIASVQNVARNATLSNVKVLLNYYYVQPEVRYSFNTNAEILIEQYQTALFSNYSVGSDHTPLFKKSSTQTLPFIHPVKQVFWMVQNESELSNVAASLNYIPATAAASFYFFGQEKVAQRVTYYETIQPYFYNTSIPSTHICSYNFGLSTSLVQPTGTIDLSRILDKTLRIEFVPGISTATQTRVCAINYNIVSIANGFATVHFVS